jgi:putative heme-binding domain-containing protein
MPLAWTTSYPSRAGPARVFMATLGASEDFEDANFRRLLVNACYWAVGLEQAIRPDHDATPAGPFAPTLFGFKQARRGVTPAVLQAAASPPARLELRPQDRVAFVGGSTAERMNRGGHFETLLHARFPKHELSVRNFGWPGDEAGLRQRPDNYTKIDDPFAVFNPRVAIGFFGANEAFAGRAGLRAFKENLAKWIEEMRAGSDGSTRRLALVTPAAHEATGDPFLPDPSARNEDLRLYAEAVREVAAEGGVPVVDLFTPTRRTFAEKQGGPFTLDGARPTEAGERLLAERLDAGLFDGPNPARWGEPAFERLRAAVNDKSFVHFHDYRMVNGWYVYGGRRAPYDTETFPAEYAKLRRMAAARDRRVWALARGDPAPDAPDDRDTGTLADPPTTFGSKTYSEPKDLRYLTVEQSLRAFTLPPDYAIQCFASEERFPELANPVQINFDGRGRLWALVMPTYPQWRPGNPPPDDKLLIFEDDDGDGAADRVKTFAGGLHVPIGFEFGQGGVYVAQPPHLLFLKDTDGDDRADRREVLLDGFGAEDTHVGICALEWSPGGELMMLEGVAKSTTVETLHGVVRNHTPAVFGYDPRTRGLRVHIRPAVVNPWACVFDGWGQGFYGDGTTATQHWMTPLSGAPFAGRKGLDSFLQYPGARLRPMAGNEFVSSRHFPDDAQGDYLFACVINLNGIPRFRVRDEGSGFRGERLADLVVSSDRNFRPVDPQFGADGALYFADWHTPLIGHMQYSQRDPNRDHRHGRIYRITAKDRPLVKPQVAAGSPLDNLFQQLAAPEDRTRYRARRELRDRPADTTLAALDAWLDARPTDDPLRDRLTCEAMWVRQGFHAVDPERLGRLLGAQDFHARAAAVHVLADEREFLLRDRGEERLNLLRAAVLDEHPRVRLEAVRALGFMPTLEAVETALEAVNLPLDPTLRYTLESTLGALAPVWQPALGSGAVARDNPAGLAFLQGKHADRAPSEQVQKQFALLVQGNTNEETRRRALATLAAAPGDAASGRAVFTRTCVACHRHRALGDAAGTDLGPALDGLGGRQKRAQIVESILEPNASVDPRYYVVNLTTTAGEELSGRVLAEDAAGVTLAPAGGAGTTRVIPVAGIRARSTVKVSTMPDGASTSSSSATTTRTFEWGVAKAAELGYEYVEPMVHWGRELLSEAGYFHSVSMLDDPLRVRRACEKAGVKLSGLSTHTPLTKPEISVEYLKQAIRFAAECGAPVVNTDEGPKPAWTTEDEDFTSSCATRSWRRPKSPNRAASSSASSATSSTARRPTGLDRASRSW